MPTLSGAIRNPKITRYSAAGITAVGAAALALTVVPGSASAGEPHESAAKLPMQPTAYETPGSQPTTTGSGTVKLLSAKQGTLDPDAARTQRTIEARQAAETAKAERAAQQAQQKQEAASKAADGRAKTDAASRSEARPEVKSYPNNLDGWIREARSIMAKHGIVGSYDGIKRNIIRESGGDPNAVNDWDVNAKMGIPSKGLLQVIQPTFDQYHVDGTADKLTDPVANIVAACNYAMHRYGSMDNVDSAY